MWVRLCVVAVSRFNIYGDYDTFRDLFLTQTLGRVSVDRLRVQYTRVIIKWTKKSNSENAKRRENEGVKSQILGNALGGGFNTCWELAKEIRRVDVCERERENS